jgi:hypothetical protein
MMANDGCAREIGVGEGSIHDDRGWAVGFAADFAGEQRDARSGELAGGDEAVLGDDFGLCVGAAVGELEFGLIPEGNSGSADGDSRGVYAWRRAQRFENAVGELAQFFHVAGFAPIHAELEGEDVRGVKAGAGAAELLRPAEKQAGRGDLDADEQPLQRVRPETCEPLDCASEAERLWRVPRTAGTNPQRRLTTTEQAKE